jgi:hypothetical protein
VRRIDLHCYPGTAEWIASQGPFPGALAEYGKRPWEAKDEDAVMADLRMHGIEALVVASDMESVTGAPPCTNQDVASLRDRHPQTFIDAWGAVDPLKGEQAISDAESAVKDHAWSGRTRVRVSLCAR